jgi:hypothetical protein
MDNFNPVDLIGNESAEIKEPCLNAVDGDSVQQQEGVLGAHPPL